MRILHVTPYSAGAWAYGGIPRLLAALTRGLAHRGHEVTVCATDASDAAARLAGGPHGIARFGAWPPRRSIDGIEERIFPNLSNVLAYHLQLFLPLGLADYLRHHAHDFDVAHLHACRNLPGAVAAPVLRRAGVPYVLAPNGTAPLIERRILAKRLFDAAGGRGVMAGAARVLAVSRAEERQLASLGVRPSVIRTVPNPVDLDEIADLPPRGRFRGRSGLQGPLVLFLGKITPRKRVDDLVRAFARLSRRDALLAVAGNDMGGGEALRPLAASLGVANRTFFTGLLTGRQRFEALVDADVVVYPSEHEIFGLVALEAILAGTPVIVGDDSGCGEIVRDAGGGQLVPPGNVDRLAAAIDTVLKDPPRWRGEAAAAAARVRAVYGADTVCGQLEGIYEEVIAAA